MKRFTQISIILTILISLFLPLGSQEVHAAIYTYPNSVSYNIPDGTSATNTGCVAWPATRYFLVNDSFTINDLNVEFSQSHTARGQIRVTLKAPDGTQRELISTSGDVNDNYYITLDDASTNPLNDGTADTIGGTRRTVGPSVNGALDSFNGKNAHGTWLMTICDNTFNATGTSQLFNAATLVFDGTPITPVPKNHKQGPAIEETYYLPWPENQVRTAFTRTFDSNCSTFSSFQNSYDAAPREPMVSFTGITIVDAGTVITYDHWEDGYGANPSLPTQNTTEVWGDGDLTNGVAPGDADDLFVAGQVLILDNAMLSTTLGSVLDYDARDKIAASKPININRSVWSDGSQTLLAAADEVYPTDRWGTQFYSPLGDNANLYNMFDISVVSIIAAVDGTLVDIDKDGNGTYETTGIALNEGETYFIDDTGTGMYRGGGIRSNADHPIQVNLMTADRCAGYESRTYPLLPFDQWDASYYLPVSTIQTATGPGGDEAPTTVHVYNPNATSITVNYDYDTGTAGTLTIPANSSDYAVVNVGKASHFYSILLGPTSNVRDTFSTQSYSRQDGSINWATNWDETGDDDSATSGTIYINSTSNHLRFRENSTTNDSISRSVDLTGYISATLSFDTNGTNVDTTDDISIEVSSDGINFFELERFNGDPGPVTRTYDITSYISSQTTIRFIMRDTLETGIDDGNYWQFDNVDITATAPGTGDPPAFYAVASIDSETDGGTEGSENSTYDWGITMVPENVMSQWLIAGWAPGDDPTFEGTNTENTAPIWLTGGYPRGSSSSGNFDICVDYNGDGGATTDPISGRQYDRKVTGIAPLTQIKIYKGVVNPPDTATQGTAGEDQTGTSIWVCGPVSGEVLTTDVLLTGAWGADPLVTAPSKPGVDMGYTLRNQRAWRAVKSAELLVDQNSDGLYNEGDTVRYTITVFNVGATIIPEVIVRDTNDPDVTYVPNSTYLINDGTTPPSSGQIPDSPNPGDFPLDSSGSGYTYVDFDTFSSFSIYYDAVINITDPFDEDRINVAHITVGTKTVNPDVTIEIRESEELGTIGNYVWLDEDGDGDQDAGETGIPNVLVTITNGTDTYTTYTDANGGYIFTDLPEGTWTVTVTPPAGLNPTYDEDGIATPNVSVVTLGAGEEHLSADFGYNWSTPQETNDPGTGALGAIGDRVWVDVDGDGAQDPSEIGIPGIDVQLWYDLDGDGIIDTLYGTTTTDITGNYIFDDLPAGIYEVRIPSPPNGYTQTGDPDGVLDNKTTSPIVLGPGDVFLNADFGYQPTTAEVGQIGDTVWLDANANGVQDANGDAEYGLAGVTVTLIADLNGDGVYTPGVDLIIATDITDANGNYLFSGLPATGTEDYLVWVNDTENVLSEFEPTYDDDDQTPPITTPNISAVTNLTTAGDFDQDFGYAPPNHDPGDGLIGDTVFLDLNNDGGWDPGEGIEGVVVRLYAADGTTILAETTTNEDGIYAFGDLAVNQTYIVQVQTGTLPYPGLTNTVDPDGGNDSLSTVTLTSANPINLDQDFGYRAPVPNTIGGTIWEDTDADGILDAGESGRYEGVTVVLLDANGDIVARTVTDANGDYEFTGLPDGTYTVDVTDDANILNGTWHSEGPTPGADNNSQIDPYTVTVSGGQTNTTADFGYYIEPAALGNWVWYDANKNGIQDVGDIGIANVKVTLTIAWPNGGTTILTTYTDADGYYSFENLLLDEDYNGVGSGEPTFTITVEKPTNYVPTTIGVGTDPSVDSNDPTGTLAAPIQGSYNETYDFGYQANPTNVDLVSFTATAVGQSIVLQWEMATEMGIASYNLYRATTEDIAQSTLLDTKPASIPPGFDVLHEYTDTGVIKDVRYYYWLEIVYNDGRDNFVSESVDAMYRDLPYQIFLPLIIGAQ